MSVFIKRNRPSVRNYPIGYKMRKAQGQVGIEVEVEGNWFRKGGESDDEEECDNGNLPDYWCYHHDGSLRGEDNAEYVLRRPIPFDKVGEAVDSLWQMFKEDNTVLTESNRTSVHVHLNIQQFHLNRLCSLLALYLSVEEVLTAWCGESRVGNLFCLRTKDAPAILSRMREYFRENGEVRFSDGMHYAGINPQAIHKLGSVEIRTLRGATEPELIKKWVAILERLYTLSEAFPDPRSICDAFSANGPSGFFMEILGEHANTVASECGYNTEQLNNALYDGIRAAQELCYACDWDAFVPTKIKIDPFQRVIEDPQDDPSYQGMSVSQALGAIPHTPMPISPIDWAMLNQLNVEDYEEVVDHDD